MFFYHQMSGGEDPWLEALASARPTIIATKKPRFVTVLDLFELVHDGMSKEQIAAIRYFGPAYFDWDATELSFTILKVNQFRERLVGLGVNPEAVRWYATGGRGFHAELPMELFIAKVNKNGYQHLPQIYREMAFELFTDSMDMRVYSSRRGRMWRTPNVERENGRYKVPISVAELESMSVEAYEEITAAPREGPQIAAPEYSHELGLLYEKSRLKVEDGAKKRRAGAKDLDLLKRFRGDFPPTLLRMMQGEGIKSNVGFHQIAMQIAITANAIGKKDEDVLAACEGLIENHVSDGHRYNTPKKRRAELERMLDYTRDNVCYGYSTGAVKVLCAPDTDTADLDGMPSDAGGRVDQSPVAAEVDAPSEEGSMDLRGGLEMRENGVYKKDQENGIQMISDISYKNVKVLMSLPAGDKPSELWGYEADVFLKGQERGRQQIDMQIFLSKQRYQEFAMKNMGVMRGGDNDVAGLSTIVRDMGTRSGGVVYVLRREGLDYVTRPNSDPPVKDMVWVETSGVYGGGDVPYVFRPQVPSGSVFQSDIWQAPPLTGSEDERAYFEALFNVNDPTVMAPLLGWFTACYHRMLYDAIYNKFPICQVWGQAGSGKTETARMLAYLHYYSGEPVDLNCASSTPYFLQLNASSSASIPLILDEYKPRQMPARIKEILPNIFRAAYNNSGYGRGGDSDQIGQSWKSVSKLVYSTPLLYIGEAIESEPALMERTISIPVSKAGIVGRSKHYKTAWAGRKTLSSTGRCLAAATFGMQEETLHEMLESNLVQVEKLFKADTQHRVSYNLAVALTGFDFLTQVLRHYFKASLDTDLARLRDAILTEPASVAGTIMAEASKVLNNLAFISKSEDSFSSFALKEGVDYVFVSAAGAPCIDLKLQNCYVKYVAWAKSKGQEILYDNYDAFQHGLAHYSPTVNKVCLDSPIKDGGLAKVYRFSLVKLAEEGVQEFKKT